MKRLAILLAAAGLFAPSFITADYAESVIEAYEAGLISYSDLPDSLKSYVLVINSERGEQNRISKLLPQRDHISDVLEFYNNYDELETLADLLNEEETEMTMKNEKLVIDSTNRAPLMVPMNQMRGPQTTSNIRVKSFGPRPRRTGTPTTSGVFKPHTEKDYSYYANAMKPTVPSFANPDAFEPKQYLTRRSYYFYDKRDEQVADYIRVKNRLGNGYTGLPYTE